MNAPTFVDVIIPLSVPNLYTYEVPEEIADVIQIGSRVVVAFGRKKLLTTVVACIHNQKPEYKVKPIHDLLDEQPIVYAEQIETYQWVAKYYMCTVGQVLQAALPSGLKLSSESLIALNHEADHENLLLSDNESRLLDVLHLKKVLNFRDASKALGIKNIYQLVNNLIKKNVIHVSDTLKPKYKPKMIKKIRLHSSIDQKDLEAVFGSLESKPKQLQVLLFYLREVPVLNNWALNTKGLEKSLFLSNDLSTSSLQTLVKKTILEEFEEVASRLPDEEAESKISIQLTDYQKDKLYSITNQFKEKEGILLHGVTGSGKTEIYISLIQQVLDSGSQVLYLLPEIALTTQMVSRLRKVFGNKMGVYHSKFSENEKVEVWRGILDGTFSFILGVRSSVFLPFNHLGLIIVDEEHETSYKQFDPAPRYHARDVALMIGQKQKAKVLLGSATPSLESFFHAQSGKLGFVQLNKRYGVSELPDIQIIETGKDLKTGKMKGAFSDQLLQEIKHFISKKEQVILFKNRRGYAPYLSCTQCAWIPMCNQCNVSLTYHQYSHDLRCHYCGKKFVVPSSCQACGSEYISTVGHGTERLEDELKIHFPEAHISRMDLDTTRRKHSYQHLIEDLEAGRTNILIGTQMVTKGFDFDKVMMVGILDADRMLHFADFRAHEKTFQMITQVSGRAGRRDQKGKVFIQTKQPEHNIIQKIIHHDYHGMYNNEIEEREKYNYPPFSRLILITLQHQDKDLCSAAAHYFSKILQPIEGITLLGPESPLIDKIRNLHLKTLLIKIKRNYPQLQHIKKNMIDAQKQFKTSKFKNVRIIFDVDPY